jgi:hypothetical protein
MISEDLRRYLQESRESVLASLDGLSEYDLRRPMTPTGTNLLGLVKHLTGIESGYLGDCVGRPSPVRLPWVEDGSIWQHADMWARADETSGYLIGLYRAAWRHTDESLAQLPLDTPAHVPWWPEARRDTTFGSLLTRTVAETAHHAGHADIVRELIDGTAGGDHSDHGDAEWWTRYVAEIEAAAAQHRFAPDGPPAVR